MPVERWLERHIGYLGKRIYHDSEGLHSKQGSVKVEKLRVNRESVFEEIPRSLIGLAEIAAL